MLLSTEVRKQLHARSYRERVKKPTVPRKENVLSIIGWGMKEKDSKERQRYALGNSEKLADCIVMKRKLFKRLPWGGAPEKESTLWH